MKVEQVVHAIKNDEQLQSGVPKAVPGQTQWRNVTPDEALHIIAREGAGALRLKPLALTSVDMSVLIESGIDCTFTDDGVNPGYNGPLDGISTFTGAPGYRDGGKVWRRCTPRLDHWHAWGGGANPLPEGVECKVAHRDRAQNSAYVRPSERFNWKHPRDGGDIIAFKVLGLADGYCWPWDAE